MTGLPTDWQLGCDGVKQRGECLLKSGQWSNCTFLVGAEPDQVVIAGHTVFLAMASPVFEAMFYGGMAERIDPIPILDIQPEVFRALVEYIYTDNINISSFDIACELYYAAKKYMLPHLVKECTQYLWSNLTPRNACRAYEFARLFEENVLMDKSVEIISLHTKEVLTDSSFEDVELNTVITVFSLDRLNVDSELDLFEAVERYAKAQDKRTSEKSVSPLSENEPPNEERSKSPGSSTYKDKLPNIEDSAENSPEAVMNAHKASESSDQPLPRPSNKGKKKPDTKLDKPTIRSAIEKIRFLTLTPQQFAQGPARSSLLTKSETFAILMNIASSVSDVAMPSGFSTCRAPRERFIRIGPSSNVPATISTNRSGAAQRPNGAPQTKVCHLKLVLLGGTAVGKTSLMNRFKNGQFVQNLEATIGVSYLKQTVCFHDTIVNFIIWDTAGPERYRSLASMYYKDAQAAIVIYDITDQDTFGCAKNWVNEIQRKSPSILIALVGNKSDLADNRMVEFHEAQAYAEENSLLFMETSVKTTMNVNDIFLAIANKLQASEAATAGGARHSHLGDNEKARMDCCIC